MTVALNPTYFLESPALVVWGADVELKGAVDFSGLLGQERFHLVLNLEGFGIVFGEQTRLAMAAGTTSIFRTSASERLHASRLGERGGRHRLVVVSARAGWLDEQFGSMRASLHPVLCSGSILPHPTGYLRSMNLAERDLVESMLQPPVPRVIRPAWFRAKALECFSLFGVKREAEGSADDPLQQRVDAATQWLREHFRGELNLSQLARRVGCAPHYLSRIYRLRTGKTLSQKLREIRIDHAARLLGEGGSNVTEAAFEVGYQSLSHFTKAFVAEKGRLPSEWKSS